MKPSGTGAAENRPDVTALANEPRRLLLTAALLSACSLIGLPGLVLLLGLPADSAQAAPPDDAGAKVVELLPQVNLARDRIRGRASWQDGKLSFVPGEEACVQLPGAVPNEYVLEIVAARGKVDSNVPALVVGLVVGDHVTTLIIDGEQRSALWPVDGRGWQDNPTTTPPQWRFEEGTRGTVRCTVKKASVLVEFDGQKVLEFAGDFARLAPGWQFARRDRLVIGSVAGHTIERVTLRPLGDSAPANETSASNDAEEPPPVKMPDAQVTAAAREKIRETMAEAYLAARTPNQLAVLSERLAKLARESRSEVEQLALRLEAQQLAMEAGRLPLAVEILDALAADFAADRLSLTADFCDALSEDTKGYIYGRQLVRLLEPRLREALLTGRAELAMRFAAQAQAAAERVNDETLVDKFRDQHEQLESLLAERKTASAARKKLTAEADDSAANLEWGRFLCLAGGDWAVGLPCLAKGGDEALAALARDDLAKPTDAEAQKALADRWWQLADKEAALAARQARARAGHWYGLAAAELKGLDRAVVEKRLTEIPENTIAARLPGSAGRAPDLYLSDLVPEDVQTWEGISLIAMPLVIGEVDSPWSLMVHPPAQGPGHAAFTLPGGHNFLVGKVGINDSVDPQQGHTVTPLSFRLLGDGQLLWQSRPLTTRGDSQKFVASVAGVAHLELFTDCPGNPGYAQGMWINCRLTNQPRRELGVQRAASSGEKAADIEVLEARWGGGNNWSDMTASYQALAHESLLVASSDLSRLNDPTPGWKKQLFIKFRQGQDTHERWFGEDQVVVIGQPQPSADAKPRRGLTIRRATYGAGFVWRDVTEVLASKASASQVVLQVSLDYLGLKEDHVNGARKTLFVDYVFNGVPKLAIYQDGQQAVIGQDQ